MCIWGISTTCYGAIPGVLSLLSFHAPLSLIFPKPLFRLFFGGLEEGLVLLLCLDESLLEAVGVC
jgi:hypothetical protein